MKWFRNWKERREKEKLLRKLLLSRTWVKRGWFFVSGPWAVDLAGCDGYKLLYNNDLIDSVSKKWINKTAREIYELGKIQKLDMILISEIERI